MATVKKKVIFTEASWQELYDIERSLAAEWEADQTADGAAAIPVDGVASDDGETVPASADASSEGTGTDAGAADTSESDTESPAADAAAAEEAATIDAESQVGGTAVGAAAGVPESDAETDEAADPAGMNATETVDAEPVLTGTLDDFLNKDFWSLDDAYHLLYARLQGVYNEIEPGTAGGDLMMGTDDRDIIAGNGGNDRISGGGGDDVLQGGAGDDVISAGEGFDTVRSGDGDDIVYASAGDDTLDGGAGEDTLVYAGNFSDYLFETSAPDVSGRAWFNSRHQSSETDSVGLGAQATDQFMGFETIKFADVTLTMAEFVAGSDQTVYVSGEQSIALDGFGNSTLYGDDQTNNIDAGSGDDTVFAGDGADSINTGSGSDVVDAGGGDDYVSVHVRAGDHVTVTGGAGDDYIYAFANNGYEFETGHVTAVYSGNRADYIVTNGENEPLLVADQRAGGDGNDAMSGVAHLKFADGILHVADGTFDLLT